MPSTKVMSAKSAAKRKDPDCNSDSDGPPELKPNPAELAKRQFLGLTSEKVPESKHSSGGSATATVEGVVLRNSKISVNGAKGSVPKIQVTVAVTKLTLSGVKDVVSPGIDGIAFGLPTRRMEPSPEEMARNPKARGASVLEVTDEFSKANYLGTVSASFYTDAQAAKDKSGVGPEACTPGTHVLVSGVSCELARNGMQLYTNAKRITPLSAAPVAGEVAKKIVASAVSAPAQQSASLLLSMCMNGFFGSDFSEPALQQQADACRAKWTQLVEGTAAKLDAVALALGKDDSVAATVKMLTANSERIKGLSADAVATGTPLFQVENQRDCLTPYSAPIVQRGVQPAAELSAGAGQMCMELFDPEKRDRLPSSFVEGKLSNVTTRGNLVQLDFRLFFVFDKTAASLALQDGKSPILTSQMAAASCKFSKKSLGPELFGTNVHSKIEFAATEVLPVCDMALHASVFPRGADDVSLDGHFANSNGIDLVDGIKKVGVAVSEKWLDTSMLGGRSVYIYNAPEGVDLVETAATAGPVPVLAKQGYQAITESSFDFDSLAVPAGKARYFYVLYDGCRSAVAEKPSLAASVDDGEMFIADVAKDRANGDLKSFLKNGCLIYAVAE